MLYNLNNNAVYNKIFIFYKAVGASSQNTTVKNLFNNLFAPMPPWENNGNNKAKMIWTSY